MVQVFGHIDSLDIPAPQPGVPARPDEATVTFTLEWPNVGTGTMKVYPAATNGLAVGPCRIHIDQG